MLRLIEAFHCFFAFCVSIFRILRVKQHIAYGSKIIELKKIYYPVRCFDIVFAANWSATSIWEHKEEYTEYESKTVYFDKDGKEHDKPGADYIDKSGRYTRPSIASDAIKRPWTPQQKMIPITKYKTVTDNVEQTYGYIDNRQTFQPVITYADSSESDFAKWLMSIPMNGNIKSMKALLEDCVIMPLIETDEYAKNIATSNAMDVAASQCRQEVPGNRCRDLCLSNFRANYSMQIIMLPFFSLTYEYRGQKYECWFSGVSKENTFYRNKPQDDNISQEHERLGFEIKQRQKDWMKSVLISFIAMPIAIFIALVLAMVNTTGTILTVAGIITEVIFIRKFLAVHNDIKNKKQVQKDYKLNLFNKRKAVADIMKNESIPEEEKQQRVYSILG